MVYAYVIMPNHVHFLWQMKMMNGKEMPHASFHKWTSHQFLHDLRTHHPRVLPYFRKQASDRRHLFWQRDALARRMGWRAVFEQKLR